MQGCHFSENLDFQALVNKLGQYPENSQVACIVCAHDIKHTLCEGREHHLCQSV